MSDPAPTESPLVNAGADGKKVIYGLAHQSNPTGTANKYLPPWHHQSPVVHRPLPPTRQQFTATLSCLRAGATTHDGLSNVSLCWPMGPCSSKAKRSGRTSRRGSHRRSRLSWGYSTVHAWLFSEWPLSCGDSHDENRTEKEFETNCAGNGLFHIRVRPLALQDTHVSRHVRLCGT